MIELSVIEHRNADLMFDTILGTITDALARSLTTRGRAGLILSGGSTPVPLLERLSQVQIAWRGVTVTLADERWVAPTDAASNERMLRAALLRERATDADFIALKTGADDPERGEAEANKRLESFAWPADVTVLGMGTDGHMASLFPRAEALGRGLVAPRGERCIALRPRTPPVDAPFPRMTLTLPALLDTGRVILILRGIEKRVRLEDALAGDDMEEMPIRAVLAQKHVPVEVHWSP